MTVWVLSASPQRAHKRTTTPAESCKRFLSCLLRRTSNHRLTCGISKTILHDLPCAIVSQRSGLHSATQMWNLQAVIGCRGASKLKPSNAAWLTVQSLLPHVHNRRLAWTQTTVSPWQNSGSAVFVTADLQYLAHYFTSRTTAQNGSTDYSGSASQSWRCWLLAASTNCYQLWRP